MKVEFCPPARLAFHFGVLLISLQLISSWLVGIYGLARENIQEVATLEKYAQLKSIKTRLASGEANLLTYYFPEGKVFCWSFYGFTLVNMAVGPGSNPAVKQWVQLELERVISSVEKMYDERPFSALTNNCPRGGIIIAGQANLLRAGYVLAGGENDSIVQAFHRQSEYLYSQFMATKTGCLESYPNLIWPCDNCCALYSLAMHDRLYGTKYGIACQKWIDFMRSHLDERSGMMVAQIDREGHTLDGPRGNALSWSLAFMPGYAPELSEQQYLLFRKNWYAPVLGMAGVREWFPGSPHKVDVYDGAVVADIGAAASGLGIAASRANSDAECWQGELRGLEAIGLPGWALNGEKTYFLRRMLLADVLALWGKTIRNWSSFTDVEVRHQPFDRKLDHNYWVVLAMATSISAVLLAVLVRSLVGRIRQYRNTEQRWSRAVILLFALQVFLLGYMLCVAEITILAIMALVSLVEDACVRPYYVKKAFGE